MNVQTMSYARENKDASFSKNVFLFLLLVFGTVLFKKYLPNVLFSSFLILTLFLFYRSKKNWFYILYTVVLTFDVGGIIGFHAYSIWSSPFIEYYVAFSIVAFIKTTGIKNQFFFVKKPFLIWSFYGVFLLIYGIIFLGIKDFEGNSGFRYYWYLINFFGTFLFFFSINKLIDYNDILKMSEVLFVLIFINLFGQIYYLVIGKPIFTSIIGIVGGESSFLSTLGENVIKNRNTMRPEYGAILRFFALFLSLYYYYIREKYFNKTYLLIVISIIFLSTFITATRGWILSFSTILLLSTLFTKKGLKYNKIIIAGLVIITLIIAIYKPLRIQMSDALLRFETIELLLNGDVTAGGTNKRLTSRSEPVMALYKDNKVFGVGISGIGLNTADLHVGNQSILMGGGLFSLLFFLYFILYTILRISFYNRKLHLKNQKYNGVLKLIIWNFIGLLIIHSSSTAMFGWLIYIQHPEKIFFISLLFVIYNKILTYTLEKYGNLSKQQQRYCNYY